MMMLDEDTPAARCARREARSAALRERALALRQAGWIYTRIAEALGVSRARAYQIVKKAERLARNPHWTHVLPARAQSFLHVRGLAVLPEIEAARAIARLSHREIMESPNFGRRACAAVIAWLAGQGLKLTAESARDAPARERPPSDSERSVSAGRSNNHETDKRAPWYAPTAT